MKSIRVLFFLFLVASQIHCEIIRVYQGNYQYKGHPYTVPGVLDHCTLSIGNITVWGGGGGGLSSF